MKQARNEVWRTHWQLANELQGRAQASKWANLCRDTFKQLIDYNKRKRRYAIVEEMPVRKNRPAKLEDHRKKQYRDLKATTKRKVTKKVK